ncbi:hypothetical protein Ancab_036519 [Ancistrocladus abbreviatus]
MEEGSAEQIQAVSMVNAGNLVAEDRKNVRRRLVQSTLFPHKAPENKIENCDNGEVKYGVDDDEDDDDDDEEYRGSQSRRKRKQKRKATPRSRRSKKMSPNGKETFIQDMDERESPDKGIPQKPRKKQKVPVRNGRTSGTKEVYLGEVPNNPIEEGHLSQPKPDLWLEAKLTAEENSRMFAGRQLHPFFSTWKAGKKNQDIIYGESICGIAQRNARNIKFGPIHVFEDIKDDLDSMDWSNWTFCDGTFSNTIYDQETMFSTFRDSVGSLHLDDTHKVSNPLATSHLPQVISLDHYLDAQEDMSDIQTAGTYLLVDQEVAPYELLKDIKVDLEVGKVSFISGGVGSRCSDVGKQGAHLQERIISYYLSRTNQHENSLWTFKYQPEKALEVCGNGESVNIINEWLHHWRERDLRTSKNFSNANDCSLQDGEYDSYGSDSDMKSREEADGLKNVLLVTGPVGSGKSAAIYACAKEQGFQVIEVNASDWRTGAVLKQKFGEAVGSHWLKRAQENPVGSLSDFCVKSSEAAATGEGAPEEFGSRIIDLIPISETEESSNDVRIPGKFDCSENIACGQGEIKTLILFEDVDATLCEDRGFISTIQQLADIGKRPMILTTNSKKPDLPDNLDREVVCFTTPSLKELLFHVNMVCTAEKANIQPDIIERYIQYCNGDIRKTLMHLQFWCQGQGYVNDGKVKSSCGPLLFDLQAGHQVLTKVFPWDFPSQLSEVVEREITKPFCRMEENPGLFELTEEKMGNCTMWNGLDAHQCGATSIDAKKEEILRKNYFAHDDDGDLTVPIINDHELSNSSGSPIAFTRRSARRNFGTFLSSGSEDEICNDVILANSELCEKDDNELLISGVDCQLRMYHPLPDDSFQPFTDSLPHTGEAKIEEICPQFSDIMDVHLINDQCQSIDLSCVPESTFVPETEAYDEIGLPSRADLPEVVSRILFDSADPSICRLKEVSELKRSACDVDVNLLNDEVGDSHAENDQTDANTMGYQVMDECSRVDFCRGSKCLKKSRSRILVNSVQETWKKLRCTDLKHHVTSEHKDISQVVEHVYRMSNLISVSDLLLHKCQLVSNDCTDLDGETFSLRWHDQQVQMTSEFAEHGYCFYVKDVTSLASKMGMENRLDVAWEILASMSNSIALGKLLRLCRGRSQTSLSGGSLLMTSSETSISFRSEKEMSLHNILQSVVPARLYFALKGDAFPDYLSSLAQMSRSEALRLSQNNDNMKRRRVRGAKNYLSNGALSLSPEDITMLSQQNSYRKFSSQSTGMT